MKDILEKLNVAKKDLENAAFELSDDLSEEARKKFRLFLDIYLEDINVLSLLWAGYLLHEKIEKEKPKVNKEDPVNLVADEILGMSIANYIGGTNAIFNLKRYDEKKPGILSELGPMLDDVVAGLIAGIMTKVFE